MTATCVPKKFSAAYFWWCIDEDPRFKDGFEGVVLDWTKPMESSVTLVEYQTIPMLKDPDENNFGKPYDEHFARVFHHYFLTNCVVNIASTHDYMVRLEKDWVPMSQNNLKKVLDKVTMNVITTDAKGKKKVKKVYYSEYLDDPVVTQTMEKFHYRDFTDCPGCFPVWQGHRFPKLAKGEVDEDLIKPFIDHVKNIICAGNKKLFKTEMQKNAWMFQNPKLHMDWSTLLVGPQGTGKTIYCNILCNLWGEVWSNPNVTVSQVTNDISETVILYKKLVVCNELPRVTTRQGQHTEWQTLKSRISDNTVKVRKMRKNFDPNHQERNVTNYMFCTNNLDSVPMDEDDRRFFVLQVSDAQAKNVWYFSRLFRLSEDPLFLQHLLSYLLYYPCIGFDTHVPPMTDVKREMIEATQDYSVQYIKLRRWRKGTDDHTEWVEFKRVWPDYLDWLKEEVGHTKDAGAINRFTAPLIGAGWIEKRKVKPVEIRPGANLLKIWRKEDDERVEEEEVKE
jgi:hypothetical protein